jgi:hypothetical protein
VVEITGLVWTHLAIPAQDVTGRIAMGLDYGARPSEAQLGRMKTSLKIPIFRNTESYSLVGVRSYTPVSNA